MKKVVTMGIDPGLEGGLAAFLLGEIGDIEEVKLIPMPTKPGHLPGRRDVDGRIVAEWLHSIKKTHTISLVAVELVGAMPQQGVTSTFAFGKGYGKVLGLVEGMKLPLVEPKPKDWHKMILGKEPKGRAAIKQAAIRWCMQFFPDLSLLPKPTSKKPSDGLADALCMAEYARRVKGFNEAAREAEQRRGDNYHHYV